MANFNVEVIGPRYVIRDQDWLGFLRMAAWTDRYKLIGTKDEAFLEDQG